MIYTEPRRTQCGYRYSNSDLKIIHTTSVIQTDEEAIAYRDNISGWGLSFPYLIEKRDAGQDNWRMIFRGDEQGRSVHVLPGSPQGSVLTVAIPPPIIPSQPEEARAAQATAPPPPPPVNFPRPI